LLLHSIVKHHHSLIVVGALQISLDWLVGQLVSYLLTYLII